MYNHIQYYNLHSSNCRVSSFATHHVLVIISDSLSWRTLLPKGLAPRGMMAQIWCLHYLLTDLLVLRRTPSERHFVLHYYTDERCTTLKGTYIIGPDTTMEAASNIDGREHVISLTSQKVGGKVEPLFVALDSKHEQSQWLFALEEVLPPCPCPYPCPCCYRHTMLCNVTTTPTATHTTTVWYSTGDPRRLPIGVHP